LKNESEKLDIITAYKELGSYRGAADLCGTSHKTVARVVAAFEADGGAGLSEGRARTGPQLRGRQGVGRSQDRCDGGPDHRQAAAPGRPCGWV